MIGKNIVASAYVENVEESFVAFAVATGEALEYKFFNASAKNIDEAVNAAKAAHQVYKKINKHLKASFLRTIAEEIEAIGEVLINRASAESGLPLARLTGELGRTTGQLRLFANLVEEGSWVNAIIDEAQPERKPLPKPDIRRMMVPLGPVVVFGASNFPLAFSVAGGDTASALAAGCPVIVKAHPAHPGTSALVGGAIVRAVEKMGLPKGVFSLLFDSGYTVGAALVAHPEVKAVTFTGSYKGGMALVKLAQERQQPIPVFAEMGSINPVILLPEALDERAEEIASTYAGSITLGAGQFCTNPGLLLAIQSPALQLFINKLVDLIKVVPSATMLTPGICENYQKLSQQILEEQGVELLSVSDALNDAAKNQALASVAKVTATAFLANPKLQEEIFGPYSLLVVAEDLIQLLQVVNVLEGQLTTTIMSAKNELSKYTDLLNRLTDVTGRLILNGVPTGVEVCAAMQHGGPFPATNDSRFTSVGSTAVYRFVRPLAWQDWEDELLPDELKKSNPLNIFRLTDQNWSKA
ncbi:aldehyde dehydrogenase (NADP(+)) [Pedobacter sp. MC2016-14]|uniref:aldehyde dehydrogenase (NADP(+)) n=1 Tax=Pedobacter sp. MC2016-14 TaxID=2897327 RepID=UPI001E4B2240|nr:aldehyde dehydrogenase (NADP(+)) [Pedobacter sp. MC2016-14]MCD0489530.1 aldehyde dehydrogenase (NADP(+)) [Pedobacter sp. MC2016-14]